MTDNFGQYADTIVGASVSFLKSKPSSWRWDVRQIPLGRTILQFGIDGGAGLVHGVTDPNLLTVITQVTDFDDQVWLDGVPCASRVLIVLPPETHFTFIRTGPDKWLSWSMLKDEPLALKIRPPIQHQRSFRTEKYMIRLSTETASAFRSISHNVFDRGLECSPESGIEDAMFHYVEQGWDRNEGLITLPIENTRSAEEIVFRALGYVQSKRDENIEIGDLARVTQVNYRTLLRAFERYLKVSPKRYLKLRQINAVYHTIRKGGGSHPLTDILAENGVGEFGRFAGEYRAVFSELPSATQKRQTSPVDIDIPLSGGQSL